MNGKSLKKLFLIDGFGALVSAFLLGIILVKFQPFFGIPTPTLYFLAALPCLFALYDFYCFFKIDRNLGQFLKIIALTNIAYCWLSIGLAFYHFEEITAFGWAYVIVEILIVLTIAFIELRAVKNLKD